MSNELTPASLGRGHFDQNSPLSLYTKLGKHWAGRFMGKLAELSNVDDYLADETVLKEWLEKTHKYCPNGADHRYRLQFWLEYENAVKLGRQMNMANVYNLVGPETTFLHLVMRDACRVAWMLCKPISYEAQTREILATGLHRMKKALEIDPFYTADGTLRAKPDLQLLALQLKITQMMDLRQHGAPTQKIQSLSISATMGANGELQELTDQGDADAIRKRLEDLRKRKRLAEGRAPEAKAREAAPPPVDGESLPPSVIDAEVVDGGAAQ